MALLKRVPYDATDPKHPYHVTLLMPNGATQEFNILATAPSYAKDYALERIYDTKQFNWFTTALKTPNGANVKVQKMNGVRKTVSYYKVEIVTNEQYNNWTNSAIENDKKRERDRNWGY